LAKILVVDDSIVTSTMEATGLSRIGHCCRTCGSGAEALEEYDRDKPDLVLLDYMLPDIDGAEVLKSIIERDPSAIVVMVTGQGHEELAAAVMKAGARDYVVKTSRFIDPLIKTVDRVLEEDRIRRELLLKARQNERLQAQNELSYWVAHNFRNIFSGAIGFLELIKFDREDQTPEKRSYYHQQALRSMRRASEIVDQLLYLTDTPRRELGEVHLAFVVGQSLQAVKKRLESEKRDHPPYVFEDQTGRLPALVLPSGDVRLVLENLILNAVESLDAPGLVSVSAEPLQEGRLRIRVRDNGRGMDPDTVLKASEPMFSTKGAVGVGMGLSMVKAALNRHNGEMTIDSVPGTGTTVTVDLPVPQGNETGHER
jgi:signal transduction histidine kinase